MATTEPDVDVAALETELQLAHMDVEAAQQLIVAARQRMDAAIRALRVAGHTDAAIADLVGLDRNTITKRRNRT